MTVKKGYVETDEGQIHYRYAGEPSERPPLVLLHQNTCSSDMYTEAMERLEDECFVIAPDTPGFGMSYTPSDVPAIEYYAEVLGQALTNLGYEAIHVSGHHTGGSIAVEMATGDAIDVRSVSISGPPYLSAAERREYSEIYNEDATPPLDAAGEYLQYHWENHAKMGGESDLTLRHRQVVDALLARDGIAQTYGVVWNQDFAQVFDAIEVPRLIMCAPDDVLWEAFTEMRVAYPRIQAVQLDGGDYEPIRDAETFAETLSSFIQN